MRPSWRSLRLVLLVTAAWAAVTFAFNRIAGTNYGFLNGKPVTASLLDVLGPWPVYIVSATVLIVIVWVAMTLPWVRARESQPHATMVPRSMRRGGSSVG